MTAQPTLRSVPEVGTTCADADLDRPAARIRTSVTRIDGDQQVTRLDALATEEPLEIRLLSGGERQTVAITMRTPGADFELTLGFLFGEGVIASPRDVQRVSYCVDPALDAAQRYNVVNVALAAPRLPDISGLTRHFYTSSACGVCGKTSLAELAPRARVDPRPVPHVSPDLLTQLPGRLQAAQSIFQETGGLHAAALFGADGTLLALREDVGRHNAVDKVVGWAFTRGLLPLTHHVILVSGRTSYEIMQKCLVAGVPVVCAVSAPSSLAVEIARSFGMTLVGFLRGQRFNVYAGAERLGLVSSSGAPA